MKRRSTASHKVADGKAGMMHSERFFFPSKGRLERKVARRREAGLVFCGSVYCFWWGPFCMFLVFAKQA